MLSAVHLAHVNYYKFWLETNVNVDLAWSMSKALAGIYVLLMLTSMTFLNVNAFLDMLETPKIFVPNQQLQLVLQIKVLFLGQQIVHAMLVTIDIETELVYHFVSNRTKFLMVGNVYAKKGFSQLIQVHASLILVAHNQMKYLELMAVNALQDMSEIKTNSAF